MNTKLLNFFILIFFIFCSYSYSQTKTNLEVVESLIFQSVTDISKDLKNIDNTGLALEFTSAEDYKILKNFVINNLQKKGYEITEVVDTFGLTLGYNILEVKVNYPEMFRDGLFGDYLVSRNVLLKGSYSINSRKVLGKINGFSYNKIDTVTYYDVNNIENIAYSFTTGEIPEEPFFSSTLEPILAIGTAAVAVYLFFNIRSK